MWDDGNPVLVVSVSARALACAARRAGIAARAVDLFNDADTRACAEASAAVPAQGAGLDPEALLAAAQRLAPAGRGFGLVYGSGLEHCPALLERLAWGRELLGNPPEILRAVKDPALFFSLLARLGIPYPETRLERPARAEGWLVKRVGGAGGGHVHFLDAGVLEREDCYFQRHLEGRALSVLFLADGRAARIVGYSEQWQAAVAATDQRFLYGGAVALEELPPGSADDLEEVVQALVQAVGLRGLCNLDFVLDDDGLFHVLELNPRPSATLELHDGEGGLFRRHVQACRGHLPAELQSPAGIRGYVVLYAQRPLRVPTAARWPVWVADRPVAGTAIGTGQPVCTVCAEAPDGATVRRLLEARQRRLEEEMTLWRRTA